MVCPDCKGTGLYVGFTHTGPCLTCAEPQEPGWKQAFLRRLPQYIGDQWFMVVSHRDSTVLVAISMPDLNRYCVYATTRGHLFSEELGGGAGQDLRERLSLALDRVWERTTQKIDQVMA